MNVEGDTLDDLCELIVDCPHSTPEWTTEGHLVLRNQNIRNGRLDLSNPSYTNARDFAHRVRRAKPQAGDIVITREAPMGEVCMIPADLECCVGQRQVLLRPRRDVDGRYLLFALQSAPVQRQILWNEGTGSTVSNLRIPILKSLKIPRLGDENERSVAELLTGLDAKIELNSQMNETLEAMARAIFRDWFIDFGPTRAKMAGATPYLASDLWDRFPGRLDGDGKPEGWSIGKIGDLFDVTIGRTPPRQNHECFHAGGQGVTWMSIKDMGDIEVYAMGSSEDLTREAVTTYRVPVVPAGTVIVSFKLTVGRVAITARDMCTNEAIAALRLKSDTPVSSAYAYFFMAGYDYDQLGSTSSIATAVNSKSIRSIRMLFPDASSAEAFEKSVSPLLHQLEQNLVECRTLIQIRDLLLPKLMSGEVRLKETERVLEEMA